MGRVIITMSMKEAKRLHLVQKAMEKRITQGEAADMAGLCLRQMQRIVQRVRAEGDPGVCHRARGRKPNHRIPETVKDKAIELCRERYREFSPTLTSEKLLEKHRLKVSVETLRTWLLEAGLPYRKRKKRPHRQRRERKSCRGAMTGSS
jgi:transposase